MDDALLAQGRRSAAERAVERTLFGCRWLLAPFYLGLAVSLAVLLIKFVQKTGTLISYALFSLSSEVITSVLSLIDLSLIASLVLMVMLASYENFVSGFAIEGLKYKPLWMGHIDFNELKVKLLTSIVAITAIHVLELVMSVGPATNRELAWRVGILITFVVSAPLLAIMNRLNPNRTLLNCRAGRSGRPPPTMAGGPGRRETSLRATTKMPGDVDHVVDSVMTSIKPASTLW
jgi:uncharacterized protein (TIGR00645 family)